MPRRFTRSYSRGLRPRLIQTKLLSASSFSLTSAYLRSGKAEMIFFAASAVSSSRCGLTKADITGTEVASTMPLRSTMSARSDWMAPPRAATRWVGSPPSRSSET